MKKESKRTNWAEEIQAELQKRKTKGHLRTRRELSNWLDGFNFAHHPMRISLTEEEIRLLGL